MDFIMDNAPGYVIASTAMKIRNELNRRLKAFDMTTEQWGALNRLWEQDLITQKELAERIAKDQPNTGRILDKLQAKGLVERRAHPEDRRVFLVAITDAGKALREQVVPVVAGMNRDLFGDIDPDELGKMKSILHGVQRKIDIIATGMV